MVRQKLTGKKINIDDKLNALRNFFALQKDIVAVYIYGSYGTTFQTPLSDVDMAVLFKINSIPSFDKELELADKVSFVSNEDDINILILNKAPIILKHRVISEGRLVFCADKLSLADFTEHVIGRYPDFMIDMAQFYRDYESTLKEESNYGR